MHPASQGAETQEAIFLSSFFPHASSTVENLSVLDGLVPRRFSCTAFVLCPLFLSLPEQHFSLSGLSLSELELISLCSTCSVHSDQLYVFFCLTHYINTCLTKI